MPSTAHLRMAQPLPLVLGAVLLSATTLTCADNAGTITIARQLPGSHAFRADVSGQAVQVASAHPDLAAPALHANTRRPDTLSDAAMGHLHMGGLLQSEPHDVLPGAVLPRTDARPNATIGAAMSMLPAGAASMHGGIASGTRVLPSIGGVLSSSMTRGVGK